MRKADKSGALFKRRRPRTRPSVTGALPEKRLHQLRGREKTDKTGYGGRERGQSSGILWQIKA